jgi:hypothetical protein
MDEHVAQQTIERRRFNRKHPATRTAEAMGRRLLDVVVYRKNCRNGNRLELDDLSETSEVGDWKMADFKMACGYAASQGWLKIEGDTLTLTTAGLAAA